jgi:PPP family 3-phenylpropionic acid transporter
MPYWRLSGFYLFYFALLGAIIPFWNLYLADVGYSAAQIGVLGALLMGTKIVSPYLLGAFTDRSGKPMQVIRWSNFAALLCFLALFGQTLLPIEGAQRFYLLVAVIAGFSFFWNAVIGQYEAVTLLALGDHYEKYGTIRAWGSVGFIVTVILLGALFELLPIANLPLIMAVILALIWLSSMVPLSIQTSPQHSDAMGFSKILKQTDVLAFFGGCFLMKMAHGPYYIFYSIYLDGYGYSKSTIGLLWGGAVLAEFALFFVMAKVLRQYSIRTILIGSTAFAALRWWLIGYFPTQISVLIVAQALHAFTFASYHASAVEWVRRRFGNAYQGQGQAVYSAVSFGAGSALGAFISGLMWTNTLSPAWQHTWLFATVVSVAGLLVFMLLFKEPGEKSAGAG